MNKVTVAQSLNEYAHVEALCTIVSNYKVTFRLGWRDVAHVMVRGMLNLAQSAL